jgi:hypothetical protein
VDGFFAAMKLTANLAAGWHMAKTMQNAPDPTEAAA